MSDTRTVEKVVRIAAPREIVWRFWTDPARMTEWWGPAADLDARPGGVCMVEMGGGPVMRGEFVEVVPFERLVFTFGWDPMPEGTAGRARLDAQLRKHSVV